MKMPTTTNEKVKKEPHAPRSVDMDDVDSEMDFDDAGKQCLKFLEKKMRNLEKRKKKMEMNQEKASAGGKLEKEAQLSLEQYDLVSQDLRFAGELHKQLVSINEEHEDQVNKMAKKEIKRMEEVLKLQYTLDQMGGDGVRQDFMAGKHGAVVLTQKDLDQLDALYQAISPTRESKEKENDYAKKLYTAADHLVNFLNAEESKVVGTTYKDLKDLISRINGCGYFDQVQAETKQKPRDQEVVVVEEVVEEKKSEVKLESPPKEPEPLIKQQTPEESFEQAESAQPLEETPTQPQPLNTQEQDAFFAPSSTPYQSSGVSDNTSFSSQSVNSSSDVSKSLPDIQSFTHNRPFQFIQTSYVMPDSTSPAAVDPAVIAAQPAGAHGLQFISPLYDASVVTSSSVVQQQQQQPAQPPQPPHPSHQSASVGSSLRSSQTSQGGGTPASVNALGMPVDLSQAPVDLTQSGVKQQTVSTAQDFNVPPSFQQPDSLFSNPPIGHDTISTPPNMPSRPDSRTSALREASLNYDIPPSIPMPPSQGQDPTQVDPQEKKSPMNANAPVFQSMYAQGLHKQVNIGSSSDIQVSPAQSEFASSFGGPSGDFVGGGDFQSGYQGSNGFPNGNYGRGPGGNRGNYRGSRGGGGGSAPNTNTMNNRNGGSPLQNGFGPRGSATNSSNNRGGRGGNSFQNYGNPNAGYRSDSFQAGGYGSSTYGNNSYNKRGGMNNMGPGNAGGYPPRPAAMGGNPNNRGGGMRGGMARGGPRGGVPRGFSRPQ